MPAGMSGRVKGGFPGFLPKTDETRVQVLEKTIEKHRGLTFFITEKLDGTLGSVRSSARECSACAAPELVAGPDR
ncbi:MAG: hypothetical protein U0792_23645 [Gemmataceae bacterium]